jgi:predicted MPP superfamily phosphohydrolase
MLIFQLTTGLLWLFVVVRFLLPLRLAPGPTAVAALLLLLASQHHFLIRRLRGAAFAAEMPRPLGMLLNALFGTLLLLAVFQAALDLLTLAGFLLGGSLLAPPLGLRYLLGGAAVLLGMAGVWQATRVPGVKQVEIALPGLDPAFDGYRLLQLTDLHLSRMFPRSWAEGVVARANAQQADLIVLTGDLVDGSLAVREQDVAPLAGLRARDGVFLAPGNHEYYFGYEGWLGRYQQLGLQPLPNRHVLLQRGAGTLVLAGVTDSAANRFQLPPPDLGQALAGAPEVPVVLLAHQPKVAEQAAQAGVSLQLSGHTHGGMVLGLHRLVARFNQGFVSGLYRVGGMQLYVSNGTALWNGFALRLGVPPEMTVITLRSSQRP